jgi:DNA invertase Pin-like site-specific DNA recombinase
VRLIAYVRVSTEEQAASGLGLEAQEARIREECERRGWRIVHVARDDGVSARTLERPGLLDALERIARRGADGLIAAKLDRLSRSVLDFCHLVLWFEEGDATLVAMDLGVDTSTPNGKFLANVMASFAELERELISGRTKDALAALRARGEPIGRPAVTDQPELAARIREMRETEGLTLQQIADRLNTEGVPTLRGGKQWRKSSVQTAAGYRRPKPRRQTAVLPDPRRATRR